MRPPEPIVIVSTGRCGSSLLARVLAEHGVWTGWSRPGDSGNPRGYYENAALHGALNACWRPHESLFVEPGLAGAVFWRALCGHVLAREGYRGGPWLVKHGAGFWRVWASMTPVWLLPRRPLDRVFVSLRASGNSASLDDAHLRRLLAEWTEAMDMLRDERGGVDVITDDVVAGDWSSLERALEAAGVEPDRSVIARCIEPALWDRASPRQATAS